MSKKIYTTLGCTTALAFTADAWTIIAHIYGHFTDGSGFEWFGTKGTTLVGLVAGGIALAALTNYFQRLA